MKLIKLVADPFPPYQYFDENNRLQGADYEIVRAAFAYAGYEVEVSLLPWGECLSRVERGEADGIFQVQEDLSRRQHFLFSDILRLSETAFFSWPDSVQPESQSAISSPVGLLEGYSYGDQVSEAVINNSQRFDGSAALMQALVDRQLGLAVLDVGVCGFLARQTQHQLTPVSALTFSRPLCLMLNREKNVELGAFNAGLSELKSSGEYRRILEKYYVVS